MATSSKIVSGDYQITTQNVSSNVTVTTNTLKVVGAGSVSGNITVGGVASITGNATLSGSVSVTGNLSANNMSSTGNVVGALFIGDGSGLTGVAAGNALGNIISYGTTRVAIPNLSGNAYVNVAGVSNVAVFSTAGMTAIGNVTGNIITGNYWYWGNGTPFTGGGTVTYDALPVAPVGPSVGDFWFNTTNGVLYQYNDDGDSEQWVDQSGIAFPASTTGPTANAVIQRDSLGDAYANTFRGVNIVSSSNVSATGNVIASGYVLGNGSLLTGVTTTATKIINGTSQANIGTTNGNLLITIGGTDVMTVSTAGIQNNLGNGVGNIGSLSAYWNRIFATSTSALYADLAEIYESDQDYEPGTVLVFFGTKEVTTTNADHDSKVAGVVSTNPAYLMNAKTNGVALALTGRVPCKVQGPINKGDLVTTSIQPGIGQAVDPAAWVPGCVIGKSLEIIEDNSVQTIEIAVGRY